MNQETATLISLGEADELLAAKIRLDIEQIVIAYIQRNSHQIASIMVAEQQSVIERLALRALKNHLNNASNIY